MSEAQAGRSLLGESTTSDFFIPESKVSLGFKVISEYSVAEQPQDLTGRLPEEQALNIAEAKDKNETPKKQTDDETNSAALLELFQNEEIDRSVSAYLSTGTKWSGNIQQVDVESVNSSVKEVTTEKSLSLTTEGSMDEEKQKGKNKPRDPSKEENISEVETYSVPPSEFAGKGTISGDFLPAGLYRPSFPSSDTSVIEVTDVNEDEETHSKKTEGEIHLEEKLSEIDRIMYYNLYDKLDKQFKEEKARNVFLISRLAKYYQKRRMFHVLQEGKLPVDTLKKYEQQLDDFDYLTELSNNELTELRRQIEDLRKELAAREKEAQLCLEKLQHEEYEVGKETISGTQDEKIIDRYLKRQKVQLNYLTNIRLDFIKIRNKVNEAQEALDSLDNLGPDLRLIDYEQLKYDNQNLRDKLEEKDLQLTQVRQKCQHAMQILAHRREKASALNTDIYRLNERLDEVTGEYEDVREQLNQLKQERDMYRSATYKMKKDSGLLSLPKLLRDMSNTIEEGETLAAQVLEVKAGYLKTVHKVNALKQNMASNSKMDLIKAKMEGKEGSAINMLRVMSSKFLHDFPKISARGTESKSKPDKKF